MKYRFLVDKVQEAVLIVQDDTVRSVNPAATMIGGYSIDELDSAPFFDFIDSLRSRQGSRPLPARSGR